MNTLEVFHGCNSTPLASRNRYSQLEPPAIKAGVTVVVITTGDPGSQISFGVKEAVRVALANGVTYEVAVAVQPCTFVAVTV
ncbi:hypothetical protein D3C86_1262010 [compost metagenome]